MERFEPKNSQPDCERGYASDLVLPPEADATAQVLAFVEGCLEECGAPMGAVAKVMVVVDEVYSNIVNYSGATSSAVEFSFVEGVMRIAFRDNGAAFNPLAADDPDVTLGADERSTGGLGIFMVRKMMDEVAYERQGEENVLAVSLAFTPMC